MVVVIEQKNIIEQIVNKFKKIFSLDSFRITINKFLDAEYSRGLEESEIKFNMNFTSNNQDTSFLNKYVNENLENVADDMGAQLRGELSRGILNNEDLQQLKQRIKTVFKNPKFNNRLKMVIRTERLRANQMGVIEGAKQSGLNLKKYISVVMDDNTSYICKEEHKKYGTPEQAIPLNKLFIVTVKQGNKTITVKGQQPPFHPSCRSIIRFVRLDKE